MQYHLLAAEQIPNLEIFPPETRERIQPSDRNCWVIIGENEEERLMTIGVFLYHKGNNSMELLYIYTIPEAREDGWALGLLRYGEELFHRQGIERMICCPDGEQEEVEEVTGFLRMCDFEDSGVEWHIYTYSPEILHARNMEPFQNGTKDARYLSRNEIRYFAHQDSRMPELVKSSMLFECDPEKSAFLISKNQIDAAVLTRQDKAEVQILELYLRPGLEKKQQVLQLLGEVLKKLPETVKQITFAVRSETVKALYEYLFGKPDRDYQITRYEKELLGGTWPLEEEE